MIAPLFFFILAVLYPYSVFLGGQITSWVNKIMYDGRSVTYGGFLSGVYDVAFKLMFFYVAAIFMAPVCITYLYFYNTSNEERVIDA